VGVFFAALLSMSGPAPAGKGTFVTFDPPNSHLTEPAAINAFGDVAGTSEDNTDKPLGFARFGVDGSFAVIEFDGQSQSLVRGINDDQVITGDWSDSNSNHHCFVGVPLHKFRSCDPKDAQQAFGEAVNNQTHNGTAVVAGDYSDGQERQHAFIWEKGAATEFDVPDSTCTGAPMSINDDGTTRRHVDKRAGTRHAGSPWVCAQAIRSSWCGFL
jgi:uncharacterized membrane protein